MPKVHYSNKAVEDLSSIWDMHPRYSIDRIAGSKNQREGSQHSLTATRIAALPFLPRRGIVLALAGCAFPSSSPEGPLQK